MTNSQCIEVAEKVWGWDKKFLINVWMDYGPEGSEFDIWREEYLQEEVNSWQGFGRTVVSMREHPNRNEFFTRSYVAMAGYLAGNTGVNALFEEHHLAALEAIDAEGS